MNDIQSPTGQADGGQTNAAQTPAHNAGQATDPNQSSSIQSMPFPPEQKQKQQQQQQGSLMSSMTLPEFPTSPQSDNQLSLPNNNMTQLQQQQQQQHQHHNTSQQQAITSGQTGVQMTQPSVPVPQQHNYQQQHPPIKPLLTEEPKSDTAVEITPNQPNKQESPQKTIITKVKLSDELNILDWFRTTDIINQIAAKAKSSMDSVITTLDPGMREYLYSGGNVNIVVISDSQRLVSPIRDSFQDVFGRATVLPARYNPPSTILDYPIRTAGGFTEATQVARERIKKLRSDASSIPQNQVVIVVQSALVSVQNGSGSDKLSEWFLTYCMLIDDPVLGVTMKSFSHLIPMDQDVFETAKASSRYPESFHDRHLGFTMSIDELMASKMRLSLAEMAGDDEGCLWLPKWAGIHEVQIIRQLALTLANSYRRKWDECASIETVVS